MATIETPWPFRLKDSGIEGRGLKKRKASGGGGKKSKKSKKAKKAKKAKEAKKAKKAKDAEKSKKSKKKDRKKASKKLLEAVKVVCKRAKGKKQCKKGTAKKLCSFSKKKGCVLRDALVNAWPSDEGDGQGAFRGSGERAERLPEGITASGCHARADWLPPPVRTSATPRAALGSWSTLKWTCDLVVVKESSKPVPLTLSVESAVAPASGTATWTFVCGWFSANSSFVPPASSAPVT